MATGYSNIFGEDRIQTPLFYRTSGIMSIITNWVLDYKLETIFLAESIVIEGAKATSNQLIIPASNSHIHLYLLSSEWIEKDGRGLVEWGMEVSYDAGTNWITMGGSITPIGYLNKEILMPSMGLFGMGQITGMWRLFVIPTVTISLGLQGDFDLWQ